MTYVLSSDFSSLVISSALIEDYIASLPTPDVTLSLTVTHNCMSSTVIVLDDLNLDLVNETFTLLPSDLNMETFQDGLYSLTIASKENSTGSSTYDTSCIFMDVETSCKIVEFTAANHCPELTGFHSALLMVSNCLSCSCTSACKIYSYIQRKLNSNGDNTGCGCSS